MSKSLTNDSRQGLPSAVAVADQDRMSPVDGEGYVGIGSAPEHGQRTVFGFSASTSSAASSNLRSWNVGHVAAEEGEPCPCG